jgi:hypothetical protein
VFVYSIGFDIFIDLLTSKLKLMSEADKIVTNTIICTTCGGAGHIPSDCKFRKNPDGTFVDPNCDASFLFNGNPHEQEKLDCEVRFLSNEKYIRHLFVFHFSINR